jgi:hypothetical protein
MAKRRFWKRDQKGRFAETNGGGTKTKAKPKAKAKSKSRPSARKIAANTGKSYAKAKSARVDKRKATAPARAERKAVAAKRINAGAETAVHGVQAIDAGRRAAGYLTASGATASFAPVAAVLGVKAAIAVAESANETHRVKTLTSKSYRKGSIEERSKFDASYGKRAKVINRANNATNIVAALGAVGLVTGPLIKAQAAEQNFKRNRAAEGGRVYEANRAAAYKSRGGTSPIVPYTGASARPKEAKRKRGGVYDITSKSGKRVA